MEKKYHGSVYLKSNYSRPGLFDERISKGSFFRGYAIAMVLNICKLDHSKSGHFFQISNGF